jgi:hypothetical protein
VNLQAIAAGAVSAINPMRPLEIQVATGSVTNQDGSRTPTYANPIVVQGQVQPLSFREIQQVEGLNLNGTQRAIFINGAVNGLVRPTNQGGDLIKTMDDGKVWLVVLVSEAWPDWTRAVVTLQNGS